MCRRLQEERVLDLIECITSALARVRPLKNTDDRHLSIPSLSSDKAGLEQLNCSATMS
jgi:hypothetical protein